MEIPESLVLSTAKLLIDPCELVTEEASASCMRFTGPGRSSLVEAIISVLKENWQDNADRCILAVSVLKKMHEQVNFESSLVKSIIAVIREILSKVANLTFPLANPCLDFMTSLCLNNPGIVLPLLTDLFKEKFNICYVALLRRFLVLGLSEMEELLKSTLNEFGVFIKGAAKKEDRLLCIDVIGVVLNKLDDFEKDALLSPIGALFKVLYESWLGENVEPEVKAGIFRLSIQALPLVQRENMATRFKVLFENLPRFLSESVVDHVAAVFFSRVVESCPNQEALFGGSYDRLIVAMMNYIENNKACFIDRTEREATKSVLRMVVAIEKISPNSALDPAIAKIRSDKPNPGLIVCRKLIRAKLMREKGYPILNAVTDLLNKKLERETRYFLFGLYAELCGQRVDVNKITENVFSLISSPIVCDKVEDFEKIAVKVAPTSRIYKLLDISLDPKYITVARVGFANLANCGSQADYVGEMTTLAPRAFVYASCPYFPTTTRANIVRVMGEILQCSECQSIADSIEGLECEVCLQREVNRFIVAALEKSISAETASWWLTSAVSFVDSFATTTHPEASGKSGVPISLLRAGLYSVVAQLFNESSTLETLQSTWQPLMLKFDPSSTDECQKLATALIIMRSYNSSYATDLYRTKAESRAYGQKADGRLFVLEFASRALKFDGSFGPKVNEILFDESIPPRNGACALRRYAKYGQCDGQKLMPLITKYVSSPDPRVVKAGIGAFLKLVQNHAAPLDQSLMTPLKNVMAALHRDGAYCFKHLATELFFATPIETNFLILCGAMFNGAMEDSTECVDLLVALVKKSNGASLKSPVSAAAVSMLFMEPAFSESSRFLAQSIFQYTRDPSDFALTYFVGSEAADVEKFIAFLFSFLNKRAPWNQHACDIISGLTTDARFSDWLDQCFDNLVRVASTGGSRFAFPQLATLLYNLDTFAFISKFVSRTTPATPELIKLLGELFGEIGTTLLETGTKTTYDPSNTMHSTILRVIATSAVPECLQLNSFIFVILVMAQTHDCVDECREALLNLSEKYPEVKSQRVTSMFTVFRAGNSDFSCLRTLFSVVAKELSMSHITPFTTIAPVGALAGYTELIPQGRPLISDILRVGVLAPNAALLAFPNVKMLSADCYTEHEIGEMVSFVLDQAAQDSEAFNCIIELFDWLPKPILFSHAARIFSVTEQRLRSPSPPKEAFGCVALFGDSLIFAGRQDFKDTLPMFIAISYAYSECDDPVLIAPARAALCSCVAFCGMAKTSQALRRTSGMTQGFLKENSAVLAREMDPRVIEATFALLEEPPAAVRINAGMLLCAALNQGVGDGRGIHLRLVGLLACGDTRVKCGILRAIKAFPPAL